MQTDDTYIATVSFPSEIVNMQASRSRECVDRELLVRKGIKWQE